MPGYESMKHATSVCVVFLCAHVQFCQIGRQTATLPIWRIDVLHLVFGKSGSE